MRTENGDPRVKEVKEGVPAEVIFNQNGKKKLARQRERANKYCR